jgi:arginine-tRNA-protein transferase
MPSAILAPTKFSATELDEYLARGWRPLGQRIYSADFIQLELGDIFSVVPTRLPLNGHRFTKSQRKLLRRNGQSFRVEIRPARIDAEKRLVNDQYLLEHPTKSLQELDFHTEFDGRQIFNTMECVVYHEDKLVAFSFFDRGQNSTYSKAGIYLPLYKDYSLGTYTMLRELEWCHQNDIEYYYPGYVSPDIPLFDYKTRLGAVEFWSLQKRSWIAYRDFDNAQYGPLTLLLEHTETLQDGLETLGYQAPLYQYVFFEMQMMQKGLYKLLEHPFFLLLHCPEAQQCWIAAYNLDLDAFECWGCDFNRMITFFEAPPQGYDLFRYVLELRKLLFRTSTANEFLLKWQKTLQPGQQVLRPREN